jgi:hypothetical protein
MPAPGVVLLRVATEANEVKWTRLNVTIARLGDTLIGHYTVVEDFRIRSRPLLWRAD